MRALRVFMTFIMAAGITLGATGCGEKAAAKVNGEVITKKAWEQRFNELSKQGNFDFEGPGGEATRIEIKQRALDELIDEVLVEQEALRRGINISDSDVQRAVEDTRKGFDDDEAYQQALQAAGIDDSTVGDYVRRRLIRDALTATLDTDVQVTDAEIEAYYAQNKKDLKQPRQLVVAHITFDKDDRDTADEVLKQVQEGGNFAGLARQYSIDEATRDNGGEISSQLPLTMEVQAAAESLDPGEVYYKVVKDSADLLHIVKLISRTEERELTLTEAEEQIRTKLAADRGKERFYALVQEMRSQADIEILLQELKVPGAQTEE